MTPLSPLNRILERLNKVKKAGKGYMACCPAHDDKSPSLSVREAEDGRVLVHCFGGCSARAVMEAIELELHDLFATSLDPEERLRWERQRREDRRAYLDLLLSIGGNPEVELSDEDLERLSKATLEAEQLDAWFKDHEESQLNAAYQAVSLAGFMDTELQLANFVASEWFPKRVVTLLGGHGGTGKSSFALMMAACIACGRDIAGRDVRQGKVVFLSLEDEAQVVLYRLQCIVKQLGLDPAALQQNLAILDGTGCGMTALFMEGDRRADPFLTKHYDELLGASRGADAVFVDNSSDAYMADENSRRHVRLFMASLAKMARERDCAVVLLAHIDKTAARFGAAGNSYSGSTAWHNSSRSRLALIDANDCLKVIHEKHNYSQKAPDVLLEFRSGVVMPAPDGYRPSDEALSLFDSDEVLRAMQEMTDRGHQIPASLGGPGNIYLAMQPWLGDEGIAENARTYKKRLLAAVNLLADKGLIGKVEKVLGKNHKREFWVVSGL